tara:strand:- start:226 stop:438 length:213 start_codon:yes stop_codon:yes gene_type:complete
MIVCPSLGLIAYTLFIKNDGKVNKIMHKSNKNRSPNENTRYYPFRMSARIAMPTSITAKIIKLTIVYPCI